MSNPLFKVMCSGTSTGGTIVDGDGMSVGTPYIWDLHCESNRYQSKVFNNYESNYLDNSKIYIKIKLKGGTSYTIGMNEDKNFDGKIWLYDAEGNYIAENDDHYEYINDIYCRDVLNFTPDTDGYYIIAPGCFGTDQYAGGEFYIVMNPAPEKESSGGAGGGNIIEPDNGSYIIDVIIYNTSSSIIISDDGAFYRWHYSGY